ncbi:Small-conductance mechanosensitive channel [bioreactor metagenome]|uniref:Small-conductance mechanosensitive channel n=1 Tax=bioreactor metagenome TaxID=1076179 RepID=A0A645EPG6_9ZZZZ
MISNSKITNYSAEPLRRLDLVFSIGYGDDMGKAKEIIENVVRKNPLSILEPLPIIRVLSHSASSIDITCRVWVKTVDYFNLYFDLHEQVKQAFDESGISIPYQQMDVHIINDQS